MTLPISNNGKIEMIEDAVHGGFVLGSELSRKENTVYMDEDELRSSIDNLTEYFERMDGVEAWDTGWSYRPLGPHLENSTVYSDIPDKASEIWAFGFEATLYVMDGEEDGHKEVRVCEGLSPEFGVSIPVPSEFLDHVLHRFFNDTAETDVDFVMDRARALEESGVDKDE